MMDTVLSLFRTKYSFIQKGRKMEATRSIRDIAVDIRKDWKNVYFSAKPYLAAMYYLHSVEDYYGHDSARSIIVYFLSNAATWRGENARRIKKELKSMLGGEKHGSKSNSVGIL